MLLAAVSKIVSRLAPMIQPTRWTRTAKSGHLKMAKEVDVGAEVWKWGEGEGADGKRESAEDWRVRKGR